MRRETEKGQAADAGQRRERLPLRRHRPPTFAAGEEGPPAALRGLGHRRTDVAWASLGRSGRRRRSPYKETDNARSRCRAGEAGRTPQ